MPFHNHGVAARSSLGTQQVPGGNTWAGNTTARQFIDSAPNKQMALQAIGVAGGSLPHNNLQPYLVVTFIIALQGVFPPRG